MDHTEWARRAVAACVRKALRTAAAELLLIAAQWGPK